MPEHNLQIRNSTVDFLVFTKDAHEEGIEVRVQDHNVWLTQKAISQLFDVDRSVVTKHLKKVFESGELDEQSTCAFFAQVADNGKTYRYKFYALPAIIAVGYRTNSQRATQFRQWATKVLDTFTRQGYVLDKDRLINGQIFDEDYFDHLISEIQEIRASERRFYQKITDIYATAADHKGFFRHCPEQNALCRPWQHCRRGHCGKGGPYKKTYGVDLLAQCPGWKDRESRCLHRQELPVNG